MMTPERWQQIEQLYHDALNCEVPQRAAFLDQACASDDGLRREVEALLAANDNAGDFLDEHALAVEAKEFAAEHASTLIEKPAIQNFSHYQILSKLGAGGMGEVFLARDTTLERRVAIKILPHQFTADTDRLRRFAREAKAASALNHPNIITIYEIGEVEAATGKTHFIATEFIEGETLRRGMTEGLELRVALDIAIQVASALDAAHQAGIVHRDIKPDNIMVRPDGLVKVLDFGLAKLGTQRRTPFDDTNTSAETVGSGLKTEPGMILGTLRYMSPEQARGRAVDARSDVFSLGVVLYEMIARRPLFAGDNSADVIAAIIHKEPEPLSDFAPDTPAELERIIRKALAKDCRDRYQTTRDLQIDLQNLKQELAFQSQLSRSGQSRAHSSSPRPKPRLALKRWPIVAVTMGLLAAFLVWKYVASPSKTSFQTARRVTSLLSERISSGGVISRAEFSPPDGKLIAYSISKETNSNIWVKQFAGGEARQITDGPWLDRDPIWSPDGQILAFISNRGGTRGIWSVPYLGGESPKLLRALDLTNGTLVAWAKTGQIIYFESNSTLFRLDLTAETPPMPVNIAPKTARAKEFRLSPDETQVAYVDLIEGKFHILIFPLQGGLSKQVTFGETSEVSPAWFPDSQRIAFRSNRTGRSQIYLGWVDGRREPEQLIFSDEDHGAPTVSPDGNRIISKGERENANIYSCDLRSGRETGHTSEFGIQLFPEVSFDGQQIAFQASNASVNLDEAIAVKPVNPDSKPVRLVSPGFNAKWSPRGDALAFLRISNSKVGLWRVSTGGANPILLAAEIRLAGQTGMPYYRMAANYNWSPDSQSIAYCSAKSGQDNLWTVRGDEPSETMLTNNADPKIHITSPFWSPDGKRIAYLSGASPHLATGKKSLCIFEQGKIDIIYETEASVQFLGWAASGKELYLAQGESGPTRPQKIELLKVITDTKKPVTICKYDSAYLHSTILSFDKQQIAVASRRDGIDNIEIVSTNTGSAKRVTNNSDTTAYYSGLAWAPDGKTLFYSRQLSWVLLSLIETMEK